MTTDRGAYKIDPSNPGSDLAGETAAAMAAASIVLCRSNRAYSSELLRHAYQVFYLTRSLSLLCILRFPETILVDHFCTRQSMLAKTTLFY